MKRVLFFMLLTALFTVIIPVFLLFKHGKYEKPAETEEKIVTVYIKDEDRVEVMNEKQYLKEVVSAEMPASFEFEALKAQAVAARSYLDTRRNAYAVSGAPDVHKGADICTDYTHCKAWMPESKRREDWGADADKNWDKISRAVEDTDGEVITYNGEVISAVFHSTSSGKTESSKDVWGGDKPYLVSVDSPGDELSPKYHSEKVLTTDEFKKTVLENVEGADPSKELVGNIERSSAGGILTVVLCGVTVKGTVFRKIFDLRSTNVNIENNGKTVRLDVRGYGHGVGMSQYGANYLASCGKNYMEILKTYYTGVEIVKEQ